MGEDLKKKKLGFVSFRSPCSYINSQLVEKSVKYAQNRSTHWNFPYGR